MQSARVTCRLVLAVHLQRLLVLVLVQSLLELHELQRVTSGQWCAGGRRGGRARRRRVQTARGRGARRRAGGRI